MKTEPFGLIVGIACAILGLVISMLCINVIDIYNVFSTNSSKIEEEAMKLTTSIEDAKRESDDEIIVDSTEMLKSVSSGEIIEGTAEEIALEQKKAMQEAEEQAKEAERKKIVYDGLTLEQLSNKIDKMFKKSYLSGTGELFATYSLENDVDPYTAVAIVLLETGCEWNCSKQVRTCNNVGGMKGGPSCNGTSYKSFSSLEEGIKSFINNLSKNYYKKGLDTPEKMNSKYAASKTWASKVNKYINKIQKV